MTGMKGTTGSSEDRTPLEWLAEAAPDPADCLRRWEQDPQGAILLPAGRSWDVLVLSGALGRLTLDVLSSFLDRPGPVLGDFGDDRIGFFVPEGTAAHWFGSGVRAAGRGTWIVVPRPDSTAGGVRWLVPPDGSGTLTDPVLLELAMHEAAARMTTAEAAGGESAGDSSSDGAPPPGGAPRRTEPEDGQESGEGTRGNGATTD